MFCSINTHTNEFDIKVFLINNDNNASIIAIVVDINLQLSLRFLFIIGRLYVSAGAFLNINKIQIMLIIDLMKILISTYLQIYGNVIKLIRELTKHIQLLVACNPNDGILIKLYISVKIRTSLNIPNINADVKITIDFEINIYMASKPYFNSANLTSSQL